MLNTVQDVFDIAIRLMDAQNESTGTTDTADTKEYRLRTPSLVNSLLDRVYPGSDTYATADPGKRPICPKVAAMTDTLALDERRRSPLRPRRFAAVGGKSDAGKFLLGNLFGTAGRGQRRHPR